GHYRLSYFNSHKDDIPGRVDTIEYYPNRSANLALIHYADGEQRYILATKELEVGRVIESVEQVDIKPGNALPLGSIPVGTTVHNVELKPGRGGQLARSAGTDAQILGREGKYTLVLLASGEVRLILTTCSATVGDVGNIEHEIIRIGKADLLYWFG